MWCEKPTNCQLEYTQHGGLTCKSTWRTRRPARLQPACSARRTDRRCVVCTRVACQHPSMVCHWERPNRYWSRGGSRVDLTPISCTRSGSLYRVPQGSPRAFRVSVFWNAWDSIEANAGECGGVLRQYIEQRFQVGHQDIGRCRLAATVYQTQDLVGGYRGCHRGIRFTRRNTGEPRARLLS